MIKCIMRAPEIVGPEPCPLRTCWLGSATTQRIKTALPPLPLRSISGTPVGSTKPTNFKETWHSGVSSPWDKFKTGRLLYSAGSAPVKVLIPLWACTVPLLNRLVQSRALVQSKSAAKIFSLLTWFLKSNILLFSGSPTQLFQTNLHAITQTGDCWSKLFENFAHTSQRTSGRNLP